MLQMAGAAWVSIFLEASSKAKGKANSRGVIGMVNTAEVW